MAGGGTEFGRKLAGFRLGRGLSQDELARRSGMSVRAIRDLERGQVEHPRRITVALLTDALSLHGTHREAFENAAAGLARSRRASTQVRRGVRKRPYRANCRRILRTSPGANSPWSGCTPGCGPAKNGLQRW